MKNLFKFLTLNLIKLILFFLIQHKNYLCIKKIFFYNIDVVSLQKFI
jgi:hypothetical protein